MPVTYVSYGNGKKVSRRWYRVLTAADKAHVGFTLTSGHRTMAEQQALYNQNMIRPGVPKPGRPMTAVPSSTAPHIRVGRADHAIDVDSLNGGETRLQRFLEHNGARVMNPVAGEAWHMEVSRNDLEKLYQKFKPPPPPRPKSRASAKGVAFIAAFEGLRLHAYKAHPSEKHWTIGYGHYGPDVKPGMTITKARALQLLKGDLRRFEKAVVKWVPSRWRREQYRFDALLSAAFNLGEEVLTASPPLTSLGVALRRDKTPANIKKVAAALKLYDKAGGETLPGLTRRRNAESRLFTSGSYSTR